ECGCRQTASFLTCRASMLSPPTAREPLYADRVLSGSGARRAIDRFRFAQPILPTKLRPSVQQEDADAGSSRPGTEPGADRQSLGSDEHDAGDAPAEAGPGARR